MTKLFQKIILLIAMMTGALLNASCPANYTTVSTTISGIQFEVCYPTVVSQSVNGGDFNIYLTITNTTGSSSAGLTLCGFAPNDPAFTNVASNVTLDPANGFSSFNLTSTACGGNGKGTFVYNAGIVAGGVARAVVTMNAASIPTTNPFVYNPVAILQPNPAVVMPAISIMVEATCPVITASNGAGATACSEGNSTGNLNNFVTGGNSPYIFSTAGAVNGSVSVDSAGVYTFSPNVAGPTNGSFNFQAFDIAGCPSNTGTITLPIVPSPIGGNDVFYTTNFGTPVINTLNFTGGTPPFTITTNNINNGSVIYDSNTAQFTFTQTAPGASFFDYTVTDANGCVIDTTPNIYIYSCNPGYTPSANLFNNVIYAMCAPATVYVGSTFQITATFANPNVTGVTPVTSPLQDIVPDPSQGPAFVPGLLYLSNNGVPAGTTFVSTGVNFGLGGMGSFSIDAGQLAPNNQFSVTMNIQATAVGLQTYTVRVPSNPAFTLEVNVDVLPCPTFTGGNTGIESCNNEVTGDLSGLIEGASGPFIFSQTGIPTCGEVTISPSGIFIYTAPAGFTGPCSFDYFATLEQTPCVSSVGTVTINANLGPMAVGASVFICENTTLTGALIGFNGTPPYTFSIVTNGTLGTATITDPVNGFFEYVPNPNTFGNDFFTFQVMDSQGCTSNVAQYNIGILQGPISANTGVTGCANNSVSGDLTSAVQGGNPPYTFALVGVPVNGTVTLNPDGTYTFVPTPGVFGIGSFQYQVTDENGCTSTVGTVLIDIVRCCPLSDDPLMQLISALYWGFTGI